MKARTLPQLLLLATTLFLCACGTGDLEDQVAKLKGQVKDIEKSEAELKVKNTELQAQIDAPSPLQEQLDTANQELNGLKAEAEISINTQIENDVKMGELQNELDAAKAQIEVLQTQLASAAAAPPPAIPATPTPPAGFPTTPTTATPTPTPVAPTGFPTPPTPTGVPTPTPTAFPTTPTPATPTPMVIPTTPAPPTATLAPGVTAGLTVSVQLAVQGRTFNLPDCEVYVTEQKPNIDKWGLHLKNPEVSHNNLQAIKASLQSCIIHKMGRTDASGNVSFQQLETGTYYISTANKATARGLQWSVRHQVNPGQNVLILSTSNRTP